MVPIPAKRWKLIAKLFFLQQKFSCSAVRARSVWLPWMGIRVSFLHVWPLWLLHLSTGEIQEVGLLPLAYSSSPTNVQTPWDIPEWGNIGWAKFQKKRLTISSADDVGGRSNNNAWVYIYCVWVLELSQLGNGPSEKQSLMCWTFYMWLWQRLRLRLWHF